MTGFSETSLLHEKGSVTVSLKSVNSKNIRIHTSCNKQCIEIEKVAYDLVREHFSRGSISVMIHISLTALPDSSLKTLADTVRNLPDDLSPVTIEAGSILRELRYTESPEKLPEDLHEPAAACMQDAVKELKRSRTSEGEKLIDTIIPRALAVKDFAEKMDAKHPKIHEQLRVELEQSLNELLEITGLRVDKGDLARELAIRIEKADIREEIDRIRLHISSFIDTVESSDTVVGKKLDFICQELHREINTLGVKVKDASVAAETVTVKTEIEKIREQVQNVQ